MRTKLHWIPLALTLPLATGCGGGESAETAPPTVLPAATSADSAEQLCPKNWTWKAEQEVAGGELSAPGSIQNVPEFHDCQRFVVQSNPNGPFEYGGHFAIFATSGWSVLKMMGNAAQNWEFGFPSAEIYAHDEAYDDLGIGKGFNCLYLYYQNPKGEGKRWHAAMVQHGQVEKDCTKPMSIQTLNQIGKKLRVVRQPAGQGDSVPPVARWDWDEKRNRHYIGIYCGDAWCEVGPDAGFNASQNSVGRPKAWYDEQYLAIFAPPPTSDTDSILVPSNIRGTIIPEPLLGARDTTYFKSQWRLVAEAALAAPPETPNPYKGKLNLSMTNGTRPFNAIYLCWGTSCVDSIRPNMADSCATISEDEQLAEEEKHWFGKVVSAGTDPSDNLAAQFRCVERCDFKDSDFAIPGVVRWRWLPNDEKVWVRCAQGCCELQ